MKISLKKFLTVHLSVLAAVCIYLLLPIRCPVKYFLHFNCPACGMTRAIFSLLRGNIAGYFFYNPMALPFLAVLLFGLHKRLFPINPKIKDAIIICGTICVAIVYILRLIFMQNLF